MGKAYFSIVLKHTRAAHGLTQDQLGARLNYSASAIAMIESGKRLPRPEFAAGCDEVFGTGVMFADLRRMAVEEYMPEGLRPWAALEPDATVLRTFQPLVIPGLLQTPDYARAILSAGPLTPDEVDQGVETRLTRQAAVFERARPPQFVAIMDEGVLLRPLDIAVMLRQLGHLVKMSERRDVFLQVVPTSAGIHRGLGGPFLLASFAEGEDVGYLDNQLEGSVVVEPERIATLRWAWEAVRSAALPCELSINLVREVMKPWM